MRFPLLSAAVFALWSMSGAAFAQGYGSPPTAPVQLQGPGQDSCLQAPNVSAGQHHTQVTTCLPVGGEQMYVFQRQHAGGYRIVNAKTGGCLDMEGSTTANGGRVFDWACHGHSNQVWDVYMIPGTTASHIRNRRSGKCLTQQNGYAIQADCAGQWWDLNEQPARSPNALVQMKLKAGGLCANESWWSELEACGWNTEFKLIGIGSVGDTFYIQNPDTANCYTAAAHPHDKQHLWVKQTACTNTATNHWRMLRSGNHWLVQNVGTGQCLNARYGHTHRYTPMIVWSCTPATDNALWTMVRSR